MAKKATKKTVRTSKIGAIVAAAEVAQIRATRTVESGMVKRITVKAVNDALKVKFGNDLELVRGKGYWYFAGGDSAGWYTSSVPTNHLSSMTVEGWVAEAVRMQAEYEAKQAELRAFTPETPAVEPKPANGLQAVGSLKAGTRFIEPECGIVGVLLHANECRAHVRLECGSTEVTIGDKSFVATKAKDTDWTPSVMVRIHPEQGDATMAKKIAAKAEKSSKQAVKCGCGCGEMTKPGSKFLQGHDARFHGRCRKLADGRMQWDDLVKELGKRGEYALADYKEGRKHFPSEPATPAKKKASAKKDRLAANKKAKAAKQVKAGKKATKKKVASTETAPVTAGE